MTNNVIKNKIENKKVIALIIEANPITKGHIKIIKEAKKLSDIIICLLAPDFVQRGELAIYNKYDRAKTLIKHGADIILEMPVEYALSSAKYYARASINILNKLGIVDYLIFGSNINDIEKLNEISNEISNVLEYNDKDNTNNKQNNKYKLSLKNYNDIGFDDDKDLNNNKKRFVATSYPKYIEEKINIKLSPNDILAVEYLSALKEFKSKIIPITIKRDDTLKSATEIRNILLNRGELDEVALSGVTSPSIYDYRRGAEQSSELFRKSPSTYDYRRGELASPSIYIDKIKYPTPHTINVSLTHHLNQKLFYCLQNNIDLTTFYDIDEDFKNNILNILKNGFLEYDTLCQKLNKKHLTLANVKRKLLHILLDIKEKDVMSTSYGKNIKYVRVLAIKKESAKYLKYFSLPFITNTNKKEYKKFYETYDFNIENNPSLKINYYASLFYDMITNSKNTEGKRKFMIY